MIIEEKEKKEMKFFIKCQIEFLKKYKDWFLDNIFYNKEYKKCIFVISNKKICEKIEYNFIINDINNKELKLFKLYLNNVEIINYENIIMDNISESLYYDSCCGTKIKKIEFNKIINFIEKFIFIYKMYINNNFLN